MFRSSSVLLMTFKAAVDRFILKKLCSNHEKTKTTFTKPYQEQYVKEAYAFIVVFTVVGASMLFFLLFFWYDNFVFIYLLSFFGSDINECVRGIHKCSPDAFCNNTKGSYNCTCKNGFTGNGRECKGQRWIYQQLCNEKIKLTFALLQFYTRKI